MPELHIAIINIYYAHKNTRIPILAQLVPVYYTGCLNSIYPIIFSNTVNDRNKLLTQKVVKYILSLN